ncbi:hypothetical protein ACJIZ3_002722 [Penstemon smallii]|uniref:Uncharacterized protein n=1 Tax=Penstemon smallii TaxID=265156 RepID=A0ABD3U769_9LAMI
MGSAGFVGDKESRPSTSNSKKYNLPKKILDDCGAVNYSSVPRKLRSAIKKRARESIAPTLPISRNNNNHLSNGVATLKSGAKKFKQKKKQKRITKDEKEVAETLYALADMFSDHASKNTNKQLALELDDEPSETKPSTILEDGNSITAIEDNGIPALQEESKQISTNVTFEAVSHSLGNAQKPELTCFKQSDTHSAFGNQYYPNEGRNNGGLFQSPVLSATGDPSSKIQLPLWLKNAANCTSSQPPCTADKYPQIVVESKKSWKRCSAHVYISRLIKDLQISKGERKDGGGAGLLEKWKSSQSRTTTTTTHGGGGGGGSTTHSTEIQNATFPKTSSIKLVSDFLSLGHNSSHGAPLRNYQLSYLQPQRLSNCTPFSQPRTNFQGSISDVAAAQTPYLSSTTMAEPWGQQRRMMIPPQLQFQTRQQYKYNNNNYDGRATLAEWQQNPNSLLNYAAHPSFRHLNITELGSSKYQQLLPSQQQQQQQQQLMAAINSSRLDHRHHLQQLQERCFLATPTNLM